MAVFADELGSRSVAGGLEDEGRRDWYFGTVGVASPLEKRFESEGEFFRCTLA